MSEIKFTIPMELPSLNVRDKQHWSQRRKHKKTMSLFVPERKAKPTVKMSVRIHHYRYSEIMDDDNLVASAKSLLDILTAYNLIYDDSREWVEVTYCQEVDRKNRRTEVTIREVEK